MRARRTTPARRALAGACVAVLLALPHRADAQRQASIDSIVLRMRPRAAASPVEPPRSGASFPQAFPPHSTRRNALVITGVSAAAFAITWALPEDISLWDKSLPASYYLRRAYTRPPVWDRDPLFWNWVVHPLAGQYAYQMERNHGRSPLRGFLLSTAASVGWEYGFEAFIEQPSAQDLLITSTVGSLLGEASHQLTRRMRRNGFSTGERIVLTLVNPVQVVQHGYR